MEDAGLVGLATIAVAAFEAGDTILTAVGVALPEPTMYTIQYDEGTHVEVDGPMRHLAHSRAPNARIVFGTAARVRPVATRAIAPRDRLSFDYCATEWDMAAKFDCCCGAPTCRGAVGGFRHLAATSPHLAAALAASAASPYIVRRAAAVELQSDAVPASAPSAAAVPA